MDLVLVLGTSALAQSRFLGYFIVMLKGSMQPSLSRLDATIFGFYFIGISMHDLLFSHWSLNCLSITDNPVLRLKKKIARAGIEPLVID